MKIIVIMSSYNGERFISEQIKSILAQRYIEVILVIRDDCSSDKTCEIIENIKAVRNNVFLIKGHNIGCKCSFYAAAKYSFDTFKDVDYFAFADQDDVWDSDKLSIAINNIIKEDGEKPLLYYSQPKLVNADLIPLKNVWPNKNRNTFGEACLIQTAPGCSMVFNRKALELFLTAKPEDMILHDSWLTKVVAGCGGKIIEDPETHFSYRQHSNNVVGAKVSIIGEIKRRIRSLTTERNKRLNTLQKFYDTYENYLTEENKYILTKILSYKKKLSSKMYSIFSKQLRTNRRFSNVGYIISILLNRY